MKIPKSLHEQLVALLERPDLFAVNVEAPDRVSLAFEAAGLSLPETRTTLFFDDKHNGLDLLLPPELSAVTIEKIRSLKERGTRVDELAVELRENYLAVQRQRIHALGVERLRFELDAVEKLRGEALFRANPQDSSPVVGHKPNECRVIPLTRQSVFSGHR